MKEETGLDARVMDKLGESDYWFFSNRDRARVRKTVHFYLLECVGGDTAAHDWEVQDVKWVSLDEAMRVLTYKGEREMVEKAEQILRSDKGGDAR